VLSPWCLVWTELGRGGGGVTRDVQTWKSALQGCGLFQDAELAEFEEAFGAGLDVAAGGVGVGEVFGEEFGVEFGEGGPFEAVASRDFAVVGCRLHGAEAGFGGEGVGEALAEELGSEDVFVVGHVVGDEDGGLGGGGREFAQGVGQGHAVGGGVGGGDAVDAGGVWGDDEADGLDEEVVGGEGVAGGIGQEEGELDDAGPVGEVGDGGAVVAGDAGGFGIEEKEHG
jgi:hypothetical protein